MDNRVIFADPPTTVERQINLLAQRGMIIRDTTAAMSFLTHVNYYRFCGYALHYENMNNGVRTHQYIDKTRFEDICSLYEFDSKLRGILFSALEQIEIAFRTAVCLDMALTYNNSHWYLDSGLFSTEFKHQQLIYDATHEFERSHEVFAQSYKRKYHSPELPPVWMLTEILSMGKWSKIYGGLRHREDQKKIARQFNTSPYHLHSWMHGLSFLRNLCAHHSRIWNKTFPIMVNLTGKQMQSVQYRDRLAAFCTVTADLLTNLGKRGEFKQRLDNLMQEYPLIPLRKMGFSDNWQEGPIWR